MNFNEAQSFLYGLPRFSREAGAAYKPGLERIRALLDAMGNPHRSYPSVHVAGTNGKGSTASMIAAMATASGRRVGLHTSPHLFHLCERLRIDGEPASEEWLAHNLQRYRAAIVDIQASFFEAMVALSFLYFEKKKVDLAVVEVGLGGRLDATNVLIPQISVITRIAYDHADILGESIREIATEKAGIIKRGIPVVCGLQTSVAYDVLYETANDKQAEFHTIREEVSWNLWAEQPEGSRLELHTPQQTYSNLYLDLAGAHQIDNAALAVRTIELLYKEEPVNTCALSRVKQLSGLQGRLEMRGKEPLVVLDVGHNLEGLQAALAFMQEMLAPGKGHLYVAFGTMRDKDVHSMIQQLSLYSTKVWVLSANTERAVPPEEIARLLKEQDVSTEVKKNASDALNCFYEMARKQDGLLLTGSHFIASQFDGLLNSG